MTRCAEFCCIYCLLEGGAYVVSWSSLPQVVAGFTLFAVGLRGALAAFREASG